jgi:hypothetical protein
MAQTGYTPISLYYSSTASNVPTAGNLVAGELAINTADGKLFYKDSAGVVQVIAGKGGAGVAGGSNTQVQYNSSGSLAGSSSFTWDNANTRLGVGTSSPTTLLTVSGAGSTGLLTVNRTDGSGFINLNSSNGVGGAQIGSTGAQGLQIYTNVSTSSTLAMQILNNGNVGLGTSSPQQTLHVYQATANTDAATIQIGSASAYTGFLNLRVGTSGSGTFIGGLYTKDGSITGLQGSNGLIFSTSGSNTEQMRIDTSGNVGIGTSSPTVEWAAGTSLKVLASSTYSTLALSTTRTVADGNRIGSLVFDMPSNTATYQTRAVVEAVMSGSTANKYGASLSFATATDNTQNPTERMKLDSTGSAFISNARITPASNIAATNYYKEEKFYQYYTNASSSDICTITSTYTFGTLSVEVIVTAEYAAADTFQGASKKAMIAFRSGNIVVTDVETSVSGGLVGTINFTYVSNGVMKVNMTGATTAVGFGNGIVFVRVVGGNQSSNSKLTPQGFTLS